MASNAARRAAEELAKKYGTGLTGLIKQGWNEYPEVFAACTIAALSSIFGATSLYKYYLEDGDNREFKSCYVIMRSDDMRADRVRKLREKKAARDALEAAKK